MGALGSAGHVPCNTAPRLNLIWTRLKLNFDHVWAVELIPFYFPVCNTNALILVRFHKCGTRTRRGNEGKHTEGLLGTRKSFSVGCCVTFLACLAEVEKYLRCCEVASRTIESFWRVDKVYVVTVGYVLQHAV